MWESKYIYKGLKYKILYNYFDAFEELNKVNEECFFWIYRNEARHRGPAHPLYFIDEVMDHEWEIIKGCK